MAILKNLIVNGVTRLLGDVYASKFIGDLEGNAKTANSAAEASKATNDSSGNNISTTYIKNITASGQNLVVTKGNSNTTVPINIYESYLNWGGKNFAGSYGPVDAAMVPELGANRFAFLREAGITLEYSKDAGATWTEETDSNIKRSLFSTGTNFNIGQKGGSKEATKDWMCRVTVTTDSAGLYTSLHKFVIYCGTNSSLNCYCTIDAATKRDPNTFKVFADKITINGWSGFNVINTSIITTYGNTDTQYRYLRFTFGIGSAGTSYNNLQIIQILAFGGVGWVTPSNMAKNGHLYSYDSVQNATFPATVTASYFYGNINWTSVQNKPSYGAHTSGLYKITTDAMGLVSGATAVTTEDITSLGIPSNSTCVTKINGKTGDVTLTIPEKYTLTLTDISNVWQNKTLSVTGGALKLGDTNITTSSINLAGANSSSLYLLDSAGDVVLTGGSFKSNIGFYQTSDIRKKTLGDVIPVDFDQLFAIPKRYFTWKDDNTNSKQIGTVAQVLLKFYPELVSKDKDGYYSVDYAKLSIVALAAIDKLNERLKKLENGN